MNGVTSTLPPHVTQFRRLIGWFAVVSTTLEQPTVTRRAEDKDELKDGLLTLR